MPEFHREEYIYLAGLSHDSVIIAWGAFFFKVKEKKDGDEFKIIDDSDLEDIHPPRKSTIGASSDPYGPTTVEVFDNEGKLVASPKTEIKNYVLVTGLTPDTEYSYKITVKNEEWAAGERRDWVADSEEQGLKRIGNSYDNRFCTHPAPGQSAPLKFAVIGDFGRGVKKPSNEERRQREISQALERAVDNQELGIRLLLTTGDNIYAGKKFLGIPTGNTGDEDDDWFFTYYQPYRYVINRIPVYPSSGNHDTGESEKSDDRDQLMDNFYLIERMATDELMGHMMIKKGLFYRFRYGADIEFVCIDTTKEDGKRLFEHSTFAPFVESALPDASTVGPNAPVWRIPFSHHPPYCAGPSHKSTESMQKRLKPLFERAGVRLVLSGHEHMFQHSNVDGVDYCITGGAGKVTRDEPTHFEDAQTVTWAGEAHFLLVDVNRDRMQVIPIGEFGSGITRRFPGGGSEDTPIDILR